MKKTSNLCLTILLITIISLNAQNKSTYNTVKNQTIKFNFTYDASSIKKIFETTSSFFETIFLIFV